MAKSSRRPAAVSEPIQVYLTREDRSMLDRAAAAAGLSRAEVLRLGLRSFSARILADAHPVEKFLDRMAAASWRAEHPHRPSRAPAQRPSHHPPPPPPPPPPRSNAHPISHTPP